MAVHSHQNWLIKHIKRLDMSIFNDIHLIVEHCGTLIYMKDHPSGCHKCGLVLVAGLLNLPVFAQHLWPFPEIQGSAGLELK